MHLENILSKLHEAADPTILEYMQRYGINVKDALGISIYDLRRMAKEIPKNHMLALQLWDTGLHEVRMLACFIDEPDKITSDQMDRWGADFNSWDICDQACASLFDRNPLSWKKAIEWAESDKEFVKRAAFSLIAGLCVHDKHAGNEQFHQFFPLIKKHAEDERNYVKKAVNWALRNIGKRNMTLNQQAIKFSYELVTQDSTSAKWIGRDAIRELQSEKIQKRLRSKS